MNEQEERNQNKLLEHHVDYLHQETPLSERQAEILAMRQLRIDPDDIAANLNIESGTVNKHWNNLTTKLHQSQRLVDLFGHEPPEYTPTEQPLWQCPWELITFADYTVNNTAVSLRLYVDPRYHALGYDYLLVEHRTEKPQQWRSTTETAKSVHQSDDLRQEIYQNATSLKDWAARERLLATAGIDPGAEGAISPEKAFGVEWNSEEAKRALDAMEQYVERSERARRF